MGRRTVSDRTDGRLRDADERAAEGGSKAPGRHADARDCERFVLDYDPLACSLARKFHWCGEDVEDLQQVAREALVIAAHRFDPGHGVRFCTYAYSVIWGRLMRHVRDHVRLIRHPRSVQLAGRPYLRMVSLDALLGSEDGTLELEATLGAVDPGFDAVEYRLILRQVLATLTQEEKAALAARTRRLCGSFPQQDRSESGGAVLVLRRSGRATQRAGQKIA